MILDSCWRCHPGYPRKFFNGGKLVCRSNFRSLPLQSLRGFWRWRCRCSPHSSCPPIRLPGGMPWYDWARARRVRGLQATPCFPSTMLYWSLAKLPCSRNVWIPKSLTSQRCCHASALTAQMVLELLSPSALAWGIPRGSHPCPPTSQAGYWKESQLNCYSSNEEKPLHKGIHTIPLKQ